LVPTDLLVGQWDY